jgi:hypothetical protein
LSIQSVDLSKHNLLIILPRGESIRNFVYSGIVAQLRKEYTIILVAVKPNEFIWKLLNDTSDELRELNDCKFRYWYGLFYEIYDLAHNRYMWSEAAKVRWKMRDVESKSFKSKIARTLKKVVASLLANQTSMKILEKLDFNLASRDASVKPWIDYLKDKKIDFVFNTSHSHARNALPLVYAANKLSIKTTTFLFSWDNLTSQGRVIPRYNNYFAWNSKIKEDFHKIYPHIQKDAVIVTGTPQFIGHFQVDQHLTLEDLKQKLGLKPDESYFLYSSGMSHHMPFEPYVVGRIADILKSLGPQYRLIVRTYAKDRYDVFDALKAERPDIIIPEVNWEKNYKTPLPEDQIFFSSLLKHCIGGINVASTISLELCMFDKPAINVGYNPPDKDIYPYNYTRFYAFDHYKPIVDSGAVQVAANEDEMRRYLREAIEYPFNYQNNRKALLHNFFEGLSESNVTDNFAQKISLIAQGHES